MMVYMAGHGGHIIGDRALMSVNPWCKAETRMTTAKLHYCPEHGMERKPSMGSLIRLWTYTSQNLERYAHMGEE